MKYIEKGWENYRALVIHPNAPDIQITETKQAFFAGAAVLMSTLMAIMDPRSEVTEEDLIRMDQIQNELDVFGRALDQKYLGKPRH